MRRGGGLTGFRCFTVVVSRRRRHPTLFFIKRVRNNDFGVFRKSPEAKFRSGSLEKHPGSHIGHPKSIFSKKTKIPKIKKIKNLQNRPENQQLGPKLIQDDSPSQNKQFPTIFPSKNPQKKQKWLFSDSYERSWRETAAKMIVRTLRMFLT